ncbi:unnamed protein product [marine sediment metagenome]|uniref:Uncharacterized protein n=1 Tax=marine sediment metagenome TaxID=412755 RepID=X0U1Z3_9ZZZZ
MENKRLVYEKAIAKIESQYELKRKRIRNGIGLGVLTTILLGTLLTYKALKIQNIPKTHTIKKHELLEFAHDDVKKANLRLNQDYTRHGYDSLMVASVKSIMEESIQSVKKTKKELESLIASLEQDKEVIQFKRNEDKAADYEVVGIVGGIAVLFGLWWVSDKLHSLNENLKNKRIRKLPPP